MKKTLVILIGIFSLFACSMLKSAQEQSQHAQTNTGDNSSVVYNFFQSQYTFSNSQLIIIGVCIAVLSIAVGLLLNIAIRYLVSRYGMLMGLMYLGIGSVVLIGFMGGAAIAFV